MYLYIYVCAYETDQTNITLKMLYSVVCFIIDAHLQIISYFTYVNFSFKECALTGGENLNLLWKWLCIFSNTFLKNVLSGRNANI